MGSVGQRAAKLLSVKVREWFDPGPKVLAHTSVVKAKVSDFFLRPPTLTASNFGAL